MTTNAIDGTRALAYGTVAALTTGICSIKKAREQKTWTAYAKALILTGAAFVFGTAIGAKSTNRAEITQACSATAGKIYKDLTATAGPKLDKARLTWNTKFPVCQNELRILKNTIFG